VNLGKATSLTLEKKSRFVKRRFDIFFQPLSRWHLKLVKLGVVVKFRWATARGGRNIAIFRESDFPRTNLGATKTGLPRRKFVSIRRRVWVA